MPKRLPSPDADLLDALSREMGRQEAASPAAVGLRRPDVHVRVPRHRRDAVPEAAGIRHNVHMTVGGATSAKLIGRTAGAALSPTSALACNAMENGAAYLDAFLDDLRPRDPLEEGLCVQAAMANLRAITLTEIMSDATDLDHLRVLSELCDRAANSYRRLALALAEYREGPGRFTVNRIGQVNQADQQVVQQNFPADKVTNELGHADAPTVHAQPGRPRLPSPGDCPAPALGTVHGAADRGGEGAGERQRLPARGTVGRGRGPAARAGRAVGGTAAPAAAQRVTPPADGEGVNRAP